MPSSDRPTRTPAASIENATAGDVLQLSGDPDQQPLLITQPFNWWRFRRRVPGLPDTWFITEEAPAPRCPGARSPTAVVMTFARLSELKRAWFFFFFPPSSNVRVTYPPTNIPSRKTRSGGSSVGRKWESERNRCSGSWRGIVKIQVSGMKSPVIRTLSVWNRRVDVRSSRLASAPTLSSGLFCQKHILGHIHVS